MEDKYLTVSQLNRYIKYKLDQDHNLSNVFLKGEISNFKAHTRGHMYFTLKDEGSRINAVMFLNNAKGLNFQPVDGMKVMVIGRVSAYEATGSYQIYVDEMTQDGVGNLYIEFEKLKKKLETEGLFDATRKKKIPKFPKRIGVVTASTGAAIRDILTTIKRRWPIAEVILFPSLVQGAQASPDIVRKIKQADDFGVVTLIVGRGGGSIEDLWCFNDEEVARTICSCKTPVISGVGHEIDFTIADFVADLRAPTPTAAAELAVPNKLDFYKFVNQITIRLTKNLKNKISLYETRLEHIKKMRVLTEPKMIYLIKEEKFDLLIERLKISYERKIDVNRERLHYLKKSYVLKNPKILYDGKREQILKLVTELKINYKRKVDISYEKLLFLKNSYVLKSPEVLYKNKKQQVLKLKNDLKREIEVLEINKKNNYLQVLGKLEVLNPLLTIKRGYTVSRVGNKVIKSSKEVKHGDILEVEFMDGKVESKVL